MYAYSNGNYLKTKYEKKKPRGKDLLRVSAKKEKENEGRGDGRERESKEVH